MKDIGEQTYKISDMKQLAHTMAAKTAKYAGAIPCSCIEICFQFLNTAMIHHTANARYKSKPTAPCATKISKKALCILEKCMWSLLIK